MPDTTALSYTHFDPDFQLAALPIIGSNPSTGFLFGAAGTAAWYMGPKQTTHLSSAQISGLITSKQQKIFSIKSNVFLKDDKWDLIGDWRLFFSSAPTYGLGTGPQSKKPVANQSYEYAEGLFSEPIPTSQMMLFNYLRVHEIAMRKIRKSIYAGIGLHLDYHYQIKDNLLSLDTSNGASPRITSHYAYSTLNGFTANNYFLSGLSLNGLFDSRDNAINPYSGRYALISFRMNSNLMGSSKNSSLLWLEYRDYIHLNAARPRHLIAFWTYGNFVTSGKVPYMDLPAVGWDQFGRSGRAYTQGRFRGNNLVYGEIEYRFPLQREKDLLGGVVFVNATTASNTGYIKLFDYLDPAAGVGLRLMLKKDARVNVTADYGIGKYGAHGFFFNVNETF